MHNPAIHQDHHRGGHLALRFAGTAFHRAMSASRPRTEGLPARIVSVVSRADMGGGMSRKLSVQALATACARHPWRTIGAWVVAVFAAVVAIASLLSLTTEANPTNDPQSQRASDTLSRAFPASASVT